MVSVERLRRAPWGLFAGAAVATVALCALILQVRLAAMIETRLARATGHKVVVGSALWRGRKVIARDVRVYGAPPFEAEPLARIERVEVELGGPRGFLAPADVLADGVEVEYLATGAIDNVGWSQRARGGKGEGAGAAARVHVRRGKMRATWQPRRGPRVMARVRDFSLDVSGEGSKNVAAEGVVIDVATWLTLSFPELVAESAPGGAITVNGESAAVVIPGGGPLLAELTVAGAWSPQGTRLTVTREPGEGRPKASPRVRAAFHADGQGAQLSADVADLALRPLRALLDRAGMELDKARGDLHLLASVDGARVEVPFELDVKARGLDVRNPAVDSGSWRDLALDLHATGAVEPANARVTVRAGELEALGARLAIDGWTEIDALPRGSLRIKTPAPLPCGRLLPAQPAPVRDALAGLRLAGNLGLSVSVTFDAAMWDALALDVDVNPRCEVVAEPTALAALLEALANGTAPSGPAAALPLGRYHPDFAPLAKMPAHLPAAFLTAEDGRFFAHDGFDLEMIRRALAHDLEMRAFAKGGSTITQQLAKNLFLVQSRTLARKLEETVLAWRLNSRLDKKRLLELYLNVIELGPEIRGVKQAARAYFGKDITELRPIESAHLAALTPNPYGLARRFRDGRVDDGWLQRLYDLLGMMNRSGRLSRSDLAAARAGKLSLRKI